MNKMYRWSDEKEEPAPKVTRWRRIVENYMPGLVIYSMVAAHRKTPLRLLLRALSKRQS